MDRVAPAPEEKAARAMWIPGNKPEKAHQETRQPSAMFPAPDQTCFCDPKINTGKSAFPIFRDQPGAFANPKSD
jgi:hypothetical protein